MKALLALLVLLCASVVMVQCTPGLFDLDQLLEGVGEMLRHDGSLSNAADSDATALSSASVSKGSDDNTAGMAKTSNDASISASDSTDDTHHSSAESASPSPTEKTTIGSSLASMDRTTESSRSQRKSKIAASSTTFDDGATDITAANTSGNGGDVDNELDLEDEEGAFDDTKTVVETQLVLLAPDIPNRNVIISAPMSFEALMSSTGSVSTGNCRWGMIGILINFAAAAVSIM